MVFGINVSAALKAIGNETRYIVCDGFHNMKLHGVVMLKD